jgi:membrane protease YdiL (CAAX protease family)
LSDILVFVPLMALVFMADLGLLWRPAGIISQILLGIANLILVIVGFAVLLASLNPIDPAILKEVLGGMDTAFVSAPLGLCMLLTGLASLLFLIPALRRPVTRLIPLEAEGPVSAVVTVLSIDLIGVSILQIILLPYLFTLNLSALITPARIWVQSLSFILLGLIGVGFPLRRSFAETLDRLGCTIPRLRIVLLAIVMAAITVFLGILMELAWRGWDPEGYAQFESQFSRFFASFHSTWGLLTVGLAAGIGEEILYRGAIQPKLGLIPTSFLFAIIHSYYGFTPAFAWIFALGLGLGYLRKKTDTTTCIIFHTAYNMISFFVGTR